MSIEEKRKDLAEALKRNFEDRDLKTIVNPDEIREYIREQDELYEAFKLKKRPTPDILGVVRSACSICTKTCECYEPFEVFLLEMSEMAYCDTFVPTLCRNCKCPAYFHPPVNKDILFPVDLKEGLRNAALNDSNLNFSGVVAVFDINYNEIDTRNLHMKEQEDKLYDLLKHGGFTVVCRSVRILSSEEKVSLGQKSARMNTTGGFLDAILKNTSNTVGYLQRNTQPVIKEKQEEPLLLLCLSSIYVNSQAQFCKFMMAAKEYLPVGFNILYSSNNSTKGFTDCTVFFPEVFTLKKSCTIIPTQQYIKDNVNFDPIMSFFKMQSLRLKGKAAEQEKDVNLLRVGKIMDMLSYNGHTSLGLAEKKIENFRELQAIFEKCMENLRAESLSKYMLVNSNENKINVIGSGKVGIPLILTLASQSMDSFTFTSEKDLFTLFSYFLPSLVFSSRTLLIFRPITVRSGLNKIFLDVFKRNFFIVLQEEYRQLTTDEVYLISKDLNLRNHSEIIDFMTEGECHIVALSKFSAVEDAKVLANGCQFGRRRSEKRLLQARSFILEHDAAKNPFHIKLDEEIGLETHSKRYIKEQVQVTANLEENSLFTISPFSSIIESLDLDAIVEKNLQATKHQLDLPNFHRKQLEIERLRYFSRNFNIAVHVSNNHLSAEAEIAVFFPNLILYSDVILIMKPEALSLEADILVLFEHMNIKIIKACTENGANYYHISKIAAREEFHSVFEFKTLTQETLKPHHLSSMFILKSIPNEFEREFELISESLKNLGFLDLHLSGQQQIIDICHYILLITSFEDLDPDDIKFVYDYPEFLHYCIRVNTKQGTSKELRIRKLRKNFTSNISHELLELFDEYSVISFYYKEISKYFPKIVPNFYDFKIDPAFQDLEITRVFSCSEFKGFIFLKQISDMMKENRYREVYTKKNRGSVVSFMWGRKLALLVERIELVKCDLIEDFGPIYWNGKGKFLGFYNGSYYDFDKQKYEMYLSQIRSGWENYISVAESREIERKLQIIMGSEAFKETRAISNLGLVPDLVEFINLRVFSYKETPDVSNINYIDPKLATMNELFGRTIPEIDMKDFALVDVFPAKYHKRHMAANIIWILSVYLKYFDSKAGELSMESFEYNIMIDSLLDGFLNNYSGDEGVEGLSLLFIEYFLFSLSRAWNLVIEIIEIQTRRDNISLGGLNALTEINKLRAEENKLSKFLTLQLEILAKINLEYKPKEGEANYFKIERERYFKHYMMREYEQDLKNPKYPNEIIRAKFPTIVPAVEKYIQGSLSSVQQSWFEPISPEKSSLRPVPKSAYRFDSVLVKHSKWMTHQRQQKLIKEAVMYLTSTFLASKKNDSTFVKSPNK